MKYNGGSGYGGMTGTDRPRSKFSESRRYIGVGSNDTTLFTPNFDHNATLEQN